MTGVVPKYCFLTKGTGVAKEKLTSFEAALRDAGIAPYNIVRVSSIFPPKCKIISKKRGLEKLVPGEIIFCVMAENFTNETHRLIAASVGLAIPKNPKDFGYLSEYHTYGATDELAGDYAEDLAAQMLATTLNVKFDPNSSYDERKEIWKISDKIYKTMNITQSALGKNDLWTTVIAAAVLIP